VVVGTADVSSEAIAEIAELHPDVVTIDINLRKGTGFDVLRALATGRDKPPLRIIFSNVTGEEYRREAKGLGAEYFFDKARHMRELLQVLRRRR
jgi:DNA-binding NarL/FixJ family response regulator